MKDLANKVYPDKLYWQNLRIEFSYDELLKMDNNTSAKALGISFFLWSKNQFKNLENHAKVSVSSQIDVHHLIPDNYKTIVSINEGGTALINYMNINKNLYFKFEGQNPTGSFKDRGMTVAVSSAVSLNYKTVIAASTGNTAASAAAYAARAGIKSFIVLPKGKVALGKLAQSILYGATILEVDGSFDIAMEAVMRLYRDLKIVYPLNSFNSWRLEGQKL